MDQCSREWVSRARSSLVGAAFSRVVGRWVRDRWLDILGMVNYVWWGVRLCEWVTMEKLFEYGVQSSLCVRLSDGFL